MFDQQEAERVIRRLQPEVSETPVATASGLYTPVEKFYRRNHFPDLPQINSDWCLRVQGLVRRELAISVEGLADLPRSGVTTILECAGNGGVTGHLKRGGYGVAHWEGVKLSDILAGADVEPSAAFVTVAGLDSGRDPDESPDVDTYQRSIPLDFARDRALVATHMNGVALPPDHGHPARLVVPGWYGSDWIKWIGSITLSHEPVKTVYMDDRYRRFQDEHERSYGPMVRTVAVKSVLGQPVADQICTHGRVEVAGLAWSGSGGIVAVDARADEGEWVCMELVEAGDNGALVRWAGQLTGLDPGLHTISTRATDSSGNVQPERAHGRMYEANHILVTPVYCI
jgi:DMSO/TMAO reductase YedYZ molybdopterin-dependent catalytic subunit